MKCFELPDFSDGCTLHLVWNKKSITNLMQIFVYFSSTCFGSYAHLQEQIEFLLQMRHMVPFLQLGVLRSVRAGGEMHSYKKSAI